MTTNTTPWWTKDTVAVVTGSNKGIGYEIVRALAQQGLTVVLTARDPARGKAAVDALKAKGLESIWFHQLDVTSLESVQSLATWLKNQFGGIDILVNNAGTNAGPNGFDLGYENAKAIVETNYYGTKNVTKGLLPLLRASPAGARIVNVSSRLGLYHRLRSQTLIDTFKDEDKYTEEVIDSLATKYLEDVKTGRVDEAGWVEGAGLKVPMYSESKMFMNAFAIILAKSLSKSQPEDHRVLVTTFCPGVTQTDMLEDAFKNGFQAPGGFTAKTVGDGADSGVWLALLPKEEAIPKSGKFFGERNEFLFRLENLGF